MRDTYPLESHFCPSSVYIPATTPVVGTPYVIGLSIHRQIMTKAQDRSSEAGHFDMRNRQPTPKQASRQAGMRVSGPACLAPLPSVLGNSCSRRH
jgi:hypothetical protein